MSDTIDDLAKRAAEVVKAGGVITIRSGCRCGGELKNTGTPEWQNRWTCTKCGRNVSR